MMLRKPTKCLASIPFFLIAVLFVFLTLPDFAHAAATFSNATPAPGSIVSVWNPPIVVTATDPAAIQKDYCSMKIDAVSVWAKVAYVTKYTKVTVSFTPTMLTDGPHTVSVTVLNYSFVRTTYSWTFTVKAPPQLSSPAPTSVATTTTPTVSAQVTENGSVASVQITLNGVQIPASYNTATKTVSGTPATPLANDTDVTATVTVTDGVGAVGTITFTFHVQIYPAMPDTTTGCTDCHTTYPAAHPMTNCDGCHGPISPEGSQWTTGSPHARDARFSPEAVLADCTWCHNGLYPAVPNHLAPTGSYHVSSTDTVAGGCNACHVRTLTIEHFRRSDSGGNPLSCVTCHSSSNPTVQTAIAAGNTDCFACHAGPGGHGNTASHAVHINASIARGPAITCSDCHNTSNFPYFKSGTDANHDGKIDLSETDVCDGCHSPGGAYNGVNSTGTSVGAKDNWATGVYSGNDLQPGKEKWCIGCHDDLPSVVRTQTAANKAGDDLTYGYYATGHGDPAAYASESWQATTDSGNPGANKSCTSCHDKDSSHINNGADTSRLKSGYEDDASNSNCKQCHDPGTEASATPTFYTTYAAYQNSAHKNEKCTDCHDVHGTAGAYTAMTKANRETLCNQCHSGHGGHALGVSFGKGGKTYALQCVSCHNVHIVTGLGSASTPTVSAMTLFSNNTQVWGDGPGEKMQDYAGGTRYRTPNGDTMSASQLPDYDTFCLDCHGVNMSPSIHGNISWGGGEPHGWNSANVPNGGGLAPNWFGFGVGDDWNGDDITGPNAWPVIPTGRGEQEWTLSPYNQQERIGGANFILSCSDCHDTHASDSAKLRSTVNGGPGSTNWLTECGACHWYKSDWHAGMSCPSCHANSNSRFPGGNQVPNSIHGMQSATGDSFTRTFNSDLVADMRFENNLNDSGSFRLSGVWRATNGSFVPGRYGTAIQVNDNPVEIGTTNSYWSTDEVNHGTWKYTEMKYHTTVEAWVYPTDDSVNERQIVTKKWSMDGFLDGGYALTLKKVNGTLRAGFLVSVNGGGQFGVWDSDSNGERGAYSAVTVPLNRWTHIAATFDTNGPDRNPSDQSVGRIRIYVDGVDVTDSYPTTSQPYSEPGPGENMIFPYSQHSLPDDNVPGSPNYHLNPWGWDGNWCATPLSIGGLNWSSPNENFIGRLDEVKIWNVTKDSSYFSTVDQQQAPRISTATGTMGSDQLSIRFSKGVYANTGGTGNLQPSDFILTDTDNGRTITGVNHVAGSATATVTLSSALDDSNDLNTDMLAPAVNSIYDQYNNAAPSTAVTITPTPVSPSQVVFNLNEAPGSTYVWDDAALISGKVVGSAVLTGGEFSANGSSNYIDFPYSDTALEADTTMTVEARIKPTGVSGSYLRRILCKTTTNGNWQMSVWRSTDAVAWPNYTPAAGEASIAFWVRVQDNHGGQNFKPVLTEATNASSPEYHPIVSDHWYKVKVVWNSYKAGGTPGQPFVPADIYVDDQGTDGNGTGERWSGYANATDADQSQFTATRTLYTNDKILVEDGMFRIGTNTPGTGNFFNGLIDWITWKNTAE